MSPASRRCHAARTGSRAVGLGPDGNVILEVPILSEAGALQDSGSYDSCLRIARRRSTSDQLFLAPVRSDAVICAKIDDRSIEHGDLVLARPTSVAQEGDVVVVINGKIAVSAH